jgi:hypothetical protein
VKIEFKEWLVSMTLRGERRILDFNLGPQKSKDQNVFSSLLGQNKTKHYKFGTICI